MKLIGYFMYTVAAIIALFVMAITGITELAKGIKRAWHHLDPGDKEARKW